MFHVEFCGTPILYPQRTCTYSLFPSRMISFRQVCRNLFLSSFALEGYSARLRTPVRSSDFLGSVHSFVSLERTVTLNFSDFEFSLFFVKSSILDHGLYALVFGCPYRFHIFFVFGCTCRFHTFSTYMFYIYIYFVVSRQVKIAMSISLFFSIQNKERETRERNRPLKRKR